MNETNNQTRGCDARRRRRALAASLVLGLTAILAATAAIGQSATDRPLATAFATSGHAAFPLVVADAAAEVRIATGELADRAAHFYTFMSGDRPVEFFAIWTADNVIRTAFNACDVCFRAKLGYRHDGEFMICNNCGNRFPVVKISTVSGGCNPAPLAARIDGEDLVVAAAALGAGLPYFPQ